MQATSAASGFASHAPAGSGPIPDVPAHARAFARIPDLPPGLSPGAVALAVAVGIESVTASTSEAGWWVLHDLDRWAETLNRSPGTIRRLLGELEAAGVIDVERTEGGHRRRLRLRIDGGRWCRLPLMAPTVVAELMPDHEPGDTGRYPHHSQ